MLPTFSDALMLNVPSALKPEDASSQLLLDLFEVAPDAIVLVDGSGAIAGVNAQLESLFGYRREELLGQPVETLLPERFRAAHLGYRASYHANPRIRAMGAGLELYAMRRDGSEFPVDIMLSPLKSDGSARVMAVIRDITERKLAETALKRARDELELRVEQRTHELAQANAALRAQIEEREKAEASLREAQKMEAVGQLTGGIAHDFNNLLTVISGNLQMLRERVADHPQLVKLADAASKAASRGAELIQKLLAFSRRQPLHPKEINCNKLIAGMTELLRRTLGENIDVKTSLASGLWPALADQGQVESALLNLALNSRDAMTKGGTLTISTANAELAEASGLAAGRYVMLAVSDTGSGMPSTVAERAFEPFFTTKKAGKGTGLGLAMVYGFVRQSGGQARIESEPGRGTTVSFYLPAIASETQSETLVKPAEKHSQSRGETVLVVEDEEAVRELAAAFLADLGYRVIEASNGPGALEILRGDEAIHLMFSDVIMPGGMSGPELALEAKRLRPGLKVLFTTGYAEHALSEDEELIGKPYSKEGLAKKIRSVLDRESALR